MNFDHSSPSPAGVPVPASKLPPQAHLGSTFWGTNHCQTPLPTPSPKTHRQHQLQHKDLPQPSWWELTQTTFPSKLHQLQVGNLRFGANQPQPFAVWMLYITRCSSKGKYTLRANPITAKKSLHADKWKLSWHCHKASLVPFPRESLLIALHSPS